MIGTRVVIGGYDSEPDFSNPLSKPHVEAARAFHRPEHKLAPIADPALTHGLHDAGQAARFAEHYGEHFRWDHIQRRWLVWADQYWAIDRDGEPKRAAIEMAKDLYLHAGFESNLKTREAIAKFSIQQQSRRKVEDVLELAKVLPPIAETGNQWNRDPLLLATPAAVVDLSTRHFRDGRRDDRITMQANARFDLVTDCPRWNQFIQEVFPDSELAAYVQRALGYSATGDTREQVVFLAFGSGANGKSTLLEAISYVLGDYAYTCPFSTFEAGQRSEIGADVAALAGRRFVTSSETNSKSRFNEARLKALSGGDRMNARHLYGAPFEFQPVCKVWLSVNHKPIVRDDSFGFWRRMHLIPFTQTFAGSADDKSLKDTLRAEAPGILNWLIAGCRDWRAQGLNPPSAVLAAVDDYKRDNDPIADFIEEACETAPDYHGSASALLAHYQGWCDQQGISSRERLGRRGFGELMSRRFASKHTVRGRCYLGIQPRG